MRRAALWGWGAVIAAAGAGAAFVTLRHGPQDRAANYAALGATSLESGDARLAEDLARKAVAAMPSFVSGHVVLAHALIVQGRGDEAIAPLRAAVALPLSADDLPSIASAHLLLGRLLLDRDDAAGAAAHAADAIRIGASRAAHDLLADASVRRGDVDGGIAALEAAARTPPDDAVTWLRLAALERLVGALRRDDTLVERAAANFRRASDGGTRSGRGAEVRAAALNALGSPAVALAALERVPGPEAARLRAQAYHLLGDADAAEQVLRESVAATPTPRLHAALVRLLASRGRSEAAQEAASAASSAFPGDPAVRACVVAARRARREAADPRAQLLVAALAPDEPRDDTWGPTVIAGAAKAGSADAARIRLAVAGPDVVGEMLAGSADPGDVARIEADVASLGAADPVGATWSGALLLARGDADGAVRAARQAVAASRDRSDSRALLALALLATARPGDGVAAARYLCERRPFEPRARAILSRALLAAGDAEGAASEARRGLDTSPDDVHVLSALADALDAGARAGVAEAATVGAALAVRSGDTDRVTALLDAVRDAGAIPARVPRILAEAWTLDAERWARERAANPGDVSLVLRQADSLLLAGSPAVARRVLESAAAAEPAPVEVIRRLAAVLELLGDARAACDRYAALVAREPDDADARLALARGLVVAGDPREAVTHLLAVLRGAAPVPTKIRALRVLLVAAVPAEDDLAQIRAWRAASGDALGEAGRLVADGMLAAMRGAWGEAAAAAEAARAADPRDANALLLLAVAETRLGRLDDAVSHVRAAAAAHTGSRETAILASHVELQVAVASLAAGRPASAVAAARAAIVGSPLDELATVVLARAHADLGDETAALAEARNLDAAAPASHLGPLLRAQWALLRHDTKGALLHAREAAARAPRSGLAVAMVVAAASAGPESEHAESACRRAISAGDASGRADFLLGVVLERRGDRDGAVAAFLDAARRLPGDVTVLARLVPLLVAAGRTDEARTLARAANPGRAPRTTTTRRAWTLAAAGDLDAAADVLRAAAQDSAGDARLWVDLGRILLLAGDADEAAAAFDRALAADPHTSGAYLGLLVASMRQGRLAEAVRRFSDEAARTGDPGAWTALAMAAAARKDAAEAERCYRKALERDPSFPVAANNLAWIVGVDGKRPAEALPYAEAAAKRAPRDADIADTQGWLLHLAGRGDDALRALERACRLRPADARFHLHRAEVLASQGRQGPAAEALAEAERLDPARARADASAALREMTGVR